MELPRLSADHISSPNHSSTHNSPISPPLTHGSILQSTIQQYGTSLFLAFSTFVLSIFSVWYVYTVLVSENPVPQTLAFPPGKTVLAVQIVAHVIAFLVWQLLGSVFEALRWALASSGRGVSIPTFLALSRATSLLGVASLCSLGGPHPDSYCGLLFVALASVIGIILTSDIAFKNVYTSNYESQFRVVAGLAPFDYAVEVLFSFPGQFSIYNIPLSVINVYFMAFTYGFLLDPRYATAISPMTCSGSNCTSVFLPGGLDLVRLLGQGGGPNSTLFDGPQFANSTAIIIHNAPGYQLEFSPIEDRNTFNPATNCSIYGNTTGQGLYMCIASNGTKILAGWSVCPTRLYNISSCFNDTSWTTKLDQLITMSLFKRYATVAYDTKNLSILSVEAITSPNVTSPNVTAMIANDLKTVYSATLSAIPDYLNSSSPGFANSAMTYSTQFDLGWSLRLYQDDYPNYAQGPVSNLQNFLAIPIQFSTTALQWADFDAIPPDLETIATTAEVSYRAIAQLWTIVMFGVLSFSLTLSAIACLAWAYLSHQRSPNSSLFPEIDILSKEPHQTLSRNGEDEGTEAPTLNVQGFGQVLRESGAGNGTSGTVKKTIHGKRLYVGRLVVLDHPLDHQIIIVVADERQPLGSNIESTVLIQGHEPQRRSICTLRWLRGQLWTDEASGPLSPLHEGDTYN